MQANPTYKSHSKEFWANVRIVGQEIGYTRKGQVRQYDLQDLQRAMQKTGLGVAHLVGQDGEPTKLATDLIEYFTYRADILNNFVEHRLMDAERAQAVFDQLYTTHQPTCPIPMNKQSGDKKKVSFLTAIVNILVEAHKQEHSCDYDPRILTTITKDQRPLRTLARRVDGCFPTCVNPIAIWEIKEYYYTTTFGSRIADGVYETLLDGLELEEVFEHEHIKVEHLLIIDAYYTWWQMGKSYLCRIIDMLQMGYVDEVLFGYEVVERLPAIVASWIERIQTE